MISAPMPRVEPIHSPTTAPITDVDVAILSAEKRYGSELKRRSLKNTSRLLADSTRISSIDCGFTASSPRTMLTSVGKKQISAAIVILGSMPLPISSTRIGAFATTGIVLIITAIGKNASWIALLWTKTVASRIAAKLPSRKPPTASIAVGTTFDQRIGHLAIIVSTTSIGDGAMNGLMSKPATSAHQRKNKPINPHAGKVRRRHWSRRVGGEE